MAGGAVMATLQAGVEVEVDVLEAEAGEAEECGEDGPGEKGKHRDAAGGDEEERAIAGADDGSESDDAEDGEEDDAGDEFATASFAAEGVAEDVPAEFGESGELGAALGAGPAVV